MPPYFGTFETSKVQIKVDKFTQLFRQISDTVYTYYFIVTTYVAYTSNNDVIKRGQKWEMEWLK